MKKYKTTITFTENQVKALNNVFQWLIPHRDEYVDSGHRAGIIQVDKKLHKAVKEFAHLKRVDKRNEYMKNGGNAFLSQVIMEAREIEQIRNKYTKNENTKI